jgi:hypothetical protein
MIEKTSRQARLGRLIFLTFTRELIKHYGASSLFTLGKIIEEEKTFPVESARERKETRKEMIKEKVHEIVEAKEEELDELVRNKRFVKTEDQNWFPGPTMKKPVEFPKKVAPPQPSLFKGVKLTIPETKLPERFSYLKPIPMEIEIPLGKLDPLLKDPDVKVIECHGEDENITVKGNMGEKKTSITLNKTEIDDVINIFSERTRIPANEGVYKVAFGKLILTAIISEAIGSRFIIKKMKKNQPQMSMPYMPPH